MTDEHYEPEHRAEDGEPLVGDAPPKADVLLSNSVYDKLVAASLYVLPALAAAYFGIAQIWGLPKAEEVVGTTVVLETLLGVLLRISSQQYQNSEDRFDGQILVSPNPDTGNSDLNVRLDPAAIAMKDEVVVKIDRV